MLRLKTDFYYLNDLDMKLHFRLECVTMKRVLETAFCSPQKSGAHLTNNYWQANSHSVSECLLEFCGP